MNYLKDKTDSNKSTAPVINKIKNVSSFSSTKNQLIKIDHQNSLTFVDEEALRKIKITLYTTLASIEEEIIGKEINKFFDKFIPNNLDILSININLSKEYFQKKYINTNLELKLLDDVKSSLDNIINKNFNMEFFFFQAHIEELCKVLIYCYLDLSNGNYFFTSFNKNYKVSTQKEFIKICERIFDKNIDVIKRYKDKERDLISTCSNSTRSSFSSSGNFSYKYSSNANNDFEIPSEMIILLNKFQTIKKLKLFMPNKIDDLIPIILTLLNIDWLFPNLFEVELDISNGPLQIDLYEYFFININTSNLNKKINTRKSIVNYEKSSGNEYLNTIRQFKNNFELIVIYSYFISKMEKLKILNLIFPDSFQIEIIETLKLSDVYLINFQFLNFFTPISNLIQLNIEFNSLDTTSFEKVLSLFHKNNNLKCLKINLFVGEEHYTSQALIKLCSSLNLNLNQFFSKGKSITNSMHESNEYNNDIDDFLLMRLLDSFKENIEKFFFIFQSKLNLCEFQLKAELPRVISSNEFYVSVFHKFIFNIFSLLNNECCSLQTLKIDLPFLSFDNRKYPGISKIFEMINLKEKQMKMYNLDISLNFSKLYNIGNIISQHLKFINIGYFDLDTFTNFLKLFNQDPSYRKKSQLIGLKISLSRIIFEAKNVLKELIIFFTRNIPYNLREISLFTNLILSKEDFVKLYSTVNNNRIEILYFEFNKRCFDNYNSIKNELPVLYYRSENSKLNRKIKLIFNILFQRKKIFDKEYNSYKIYNENIFSNIQKYLETYDKKGVTINFK